MSMTIDIGNAEAIAIADNLHHALGIAIDAVSTVLAEDVERRVLNQARDLLIELADVMATIIEADRDAWSSDEDQLLTAIEKWRRANR